MEKTNEKTIEKTKNSRYRYKLNMLQPGFVMIGIMGLCSLLAFISWIFHFMILVLFFVIIAVLVFIVLTILIIIEGHQDKMLYLDAKSEDKEIM